MTRRRPSRTARSPRSPRRVVEGAGGVVLNDAGAVLLIRHRNGSWVFPKGHIEAGESKVDAAVREVEEEAGVQAVVVDPRQTWQTEYVNPRREGRRITWYLLRTQATEAVMREAIFPTGGFFEPEAAFPMLAFEEDRQLLRHALRAARRAGIVAQAGEPGASGSAAGPAGGADDGEDEGPEVGDPAGGEAAGGTRAPTPGGD
jgi:diadenosine hexaphosphate hydrolase (ATP-forming)